MAHPEGDSVLIALWQRQNVWSRAADQLKRDIGRARSRALYLAVLGAVLSTASAQVGRWNATLAWVFGLLAAVALGLAPVAGRPATAVAVRDWTRVRSVAEALKAETYTFLARVGPYRDEDRLRVLLDRTEEVVDGQPDLVRHIGGIRGVQRPLPDVHDIDSFMQHRIAEQIEGYYRPRAAEYRRRLTIVRNVEIFLAALAAVLAAVTGFFPEAGLSSWVAVVTTVGATVAAHAAAQRYDYQQVEFSRTADQLEYLRSRYSIGPRDEDADDAFVADCEQVISIQNEAWMARLVRDDPPA